MRNSLLTFSFFLFFQPIIAQDTLLIPKAAFKLFLENDYFFFPDNTDIYFTQSLKFEYLKVTPVMSKLYQHWPLFFKSDHGPINIHGYSIGQTIYTSSDITVPSIMENDRPYAGWLYIGFSTISNRYEEEKRISTDIYLGIIGPKAFAGEVQSWWHKQIGSPDPKGWPYQISNDLGFNVNLKYEQGINLSRINNTETIGFDIVPNAEILAGTVFNKIGVGILGKISFFNPTKYFHNPYGKTGTPKRLPDTFGQPNSIESGSNVLSQVLSVIPSSNVTREKSKVHSDKLFKNSNLSLYTRSSVKAVLWNSMLQGGVFSRNNPYVISARDINRLYLDVDYGITYSSSYFDLTLSRAFRTKEFKSQENIHQWGQIYITANCF